MSQDNLATIGPDFFEYVNGKLKNRWQCVLLSTTTPGVVRLQLQGAPPESEETGTIMCAEGRTVKEAIDRAIKLSERRNSDVAPA